MSEFSTALARELDDRHITHVAFASQLTRALGRARPMNSSTVSRWVKGSNTPEPPMVFAIEKALELGPGTLSRLLGYLPAEATDVLTVPAAVEVDPHLTVLGRRVVLKVYEEMVADES